MSTDVDICNLALSHLGDEATVASINPPEGSAQADHCARFYPMAVSTLLEEHPWNFATRRAQLAQVANPSSTWAYAYQVPNGMVNALAVLDPAALDDDLVGNGGPGTAYPPQRFVMESLDDGTEIVLTNQYQAVLRYTTDTVNAARFTPLFTTALSHLLASMLAGPVIKGDAGRAETKAQMALYDAWLLRAKASDANQRQRDPTRQHAVAWMANR